MLLMLCNVKERQNNKMPQTNVEFNIIKFGGYLSSLAMLRTASVRNFINCLTCWTKETERTNDAF
jgi:hypothetical protein